MARSWYEYDGSGSETVVGNYTLATFSKALCTGGNTLCQIYAVYGGVNPAFIDTALSNYFIPAKIAASAFGYPSVGQPYVYTVEI